MPRPWQTALLAAALLALAGCGDKQAAPDRAATTTEREAPAPAAPNDQATPPGRPAPPADPDRQALLDLLVPEGVPTAADGEPADVEDLAVVKRWLAALTKGDIPAAADAFADGTLVQNLRPPARLKDRAERLAFNAGFPCGAEIVDASSVKGYLVVTYRLTDRVDSPCDGPGGKAAGTIRVRDGKMTEWYRLPDPPSEAPDEDPGPVV